MIERAKIIFIHGASSSGKSTLARAVQAQIGEPFWHVSIDHLRDSGTVPMERFRRGDFRWKEHRARFFDGFHRSLVAYASAGNNLLLEHILEEPGWAVELAAMFEPFDVFSSAFIANSTNSSEGKRFAAIGRSAVPRRTFIGSMKDSATISSFARISPWKTTPRNSYPPGLRAGCHPFSRNWPATRVRFILDSRARTPSISSGANGFVFQAHCNVDIRRQVGFQQQIDFYSI